MVEPLAKSHPCEPFHKVSKTSSTHYSHHHLRGGGRRIHPVCEADDSQLQQAIEASIKLDKDLIKERKRVRHLIRQKFLRVARFTISWPMAIAFFVPLAKALRIFLLKFPMLHYGKDVLMPFELIPDFAAVLQMHLTPTNISLPC